MSTQCLTATWMSFIKQYLVLKSKAGRGLSKRIPSRINTVNTRGNSQLECVHHLRRGKH